MHVGKYLAIVWLLFAGSIAFAGEVNINTAPAEVIAKELQGIGMARARAIVAWRESNGRFSSLEQLRHVKGVGPKVIELNRESIRFEDPRP